MKSIMAIVIILNSYFVSCCIFNSDSSEKPESKDKGTFTLNIDPLTVESYPTGGGLFIITLEPGDDFEGDVSITDKFKEHTDDIIRRLNIPKP